MVVVLVVVVAIFGLGSALSIPEVWNHAKAAWKFVHNFFTTTKEVSEEVGKEVLRYKRDTHGPNGIIVLVRNRTTGVSLEEPVFHFQLVSACILVLSVCLTAYCIICIIRCFRKQQQRDQPAATHPVIIDM